MPEEIVTKADNTNYKLVKFQFLYRFRKANFRENKKKLFIFFSIYIARIILYL
jgi:hypothetical protein